MTLTKGLQVSTQDERIGVNLDTFRNDDIFVLTILAVEPSDGATYKCKTTDNSPDERTVVVSVKGNLVYVSCPKFIVHYTLIIYIIKIILINI